MPHFPQKAFVFPSFEERSYYSMKQSQAEAHSFLILQTSGVSYSISLPEDLVIRFSFKPIT